ncbi:MAG TPA: antitoxin Xre/MbcA/ParS toxin-binding domain-containing protein [Flavobacteriaceae bacterium]|nr:antitoxin Xre/MbcA/ParS toxin-binding domain-containing protein [Flavobacteriaceae bacterium]
MKSDVKNPENTFVKEAPTSYFYEGNVAVPLKDLTSVQKMKIVKRGITKSYLVNLKNKTDLDYDALAKALSVTRSTLINKKGNQKFNDKLSERIVALADLYSFGYAIFEDEERFNAWMSHPNQALGSKTPFDFIDNQYGREEIHHLIGRIAYGVYS